MEGADKPWSVLSLSLSLYIYIYIYMPTTRVAPPSPSPQPQPARCTMPRAASRALHITGTRCAIQCAATRRGLAAAASSAWSASWWIGCSRSGPCGSRRRAAPAQARGRCGRCVQGARGRQTTKEEKKGPRNLAFAWHARLARTPRGQEKRFTRQRASALF